jgi:3-phosphoinositide dependent protein kinase-1
MSAEVKDLCNRLLVVEPQKRLGSGPPDSPLSYDMLKKHPFFKGIDFTNLHKKNPPIPQPILSKLQAERKKPAEGEVVSSDDEDPLSVKLDSGSKPKTISPTSKKEDAVVKEGILPKKCGWFFYKKRKLVLTTRPRLSYYDPSDGSYKVPETF